MLVTFSFISFSNLFCADKVKAMLLQYWMKLDYTVGFTPPSISMECTVCKW